ncbi:hypothetical protein P167DRAFT_606578 [Morchella conica CCBAS932]|uniref:DUF3020 domain-containing protein n=1 Tax=Morchella conica CCBAS932 TaxID=1392247 RepID=A0A3N4KKR1_9PEZI|nr:hypothetical protein P167DRAFT_606578 [Morchella conica CCBAS932]
MNEEEVCLLQAAAGFEGDVKESVPAVVGDIEAGQLSVDDLSVEQINHALQSLVGVMGEAGTEVINQNLEHHSQQSSQPQPEVNCSISGTANNGVGNFGADLKMTKEFEGLWGIEDQNAEDDTGVGGIEDGSDIDYEVQLRELQKSLAELSRACARASTPPPSTPQTAMSSEMVVRSDQGRQISATAEQSVQFTANWIINNLQSATSTGATPSSPEDSNAKGRGRRLSIIDPSEDPLKAAERERIRVENRERKKKWRNQNQERNKDNDLRCRVTKRALHLFGAEMSIEKSNWIEREFNRRRSKRVTRTKIRDNDPATGDPNVGSSSVFPAFNQSGSSSYQVNSGELVLRNQLMNNPALFEKNAEFVIMELITLMSTEPTLLPYMVDILNNMKAEGRGPMIQNSNYQITHDIDNRITDVSDHIHSENDDGTGYGRRGSGLGLIEDGSNTGWSTGSQTPVPEGLDGITGEFESIDRITAGFETLVANLEKSLTDSDVQSNTDGTINPTPEESDQLKPNTVPVSSSSSDRVPSLDEIPIDMDFSHGNIPGPDNLDQALEDLMRGQSQAMTTSSNDGDAGPQFDEEALERLIAEGGVDVAELMKAMESEQATGGHQDQQVKALDDFSVRIDMNDRMELAQQLGQAEDSSTSHASEQPQSNCGDDEVSLEASELTLEEINSLIADLSNGSESIPMDLNGQSNKEPAPQPPPPVAPPPAFNTDHDTSDVYTPENVVAILKTLIELAVTPENYDASSTPAHNPRGTKRSSPDSCLNPSVNKRPCGRAPNNTAAMHAVSKTALNQLNGILISNGYPPTPSSSSYQNHVPSVYHSPQTTGTSGSLQSPAYIASFGTTDGMNKKLMAMKPPPYRPAGGISSGGAGINGNGGLAGVTAKRKTGDEEKKVRAMGFPPLMAGLKPKSV